MKSPTISDALHALGCDGGWKIKDGEISGWTCKTPQPSDEAIQLKLKELEKQYVDNEYQRDRQYPNLGEQFDLLFKDISEGTLDKTGGFYTAIKSVKDAHPKPSE